MKNDFQERQFEINTFTQRSLFITIILFLVIVIFLYRVFYLQILEHDEFDEAAFENKTFFEKSVCNYPDRISIALDIKQNQIATKGWKEVKDLQISDFLKSIEDLNINSIIITDVMRDGMKQGINFEMLENVMVQTKIDCVASGGVSNISDLIILKKKNYSQIKGVIVGKAIYDKNIDIAEALKIVR